MARGSFTVLYFTFDPCFKVSSKWGHYTKKVQYIIYNTAIPEDIFTKFAKNFYGYKNISIKLAYPPPWLPSPGGHLLGYDFAMVTDCLFLVSSALEDVNQFCAA